MHCKPHPSPPGRFGSALDPRCAACSHDISPNDSEIIEKGVLWVDGRSYHPRCFTDHPSQLRKRIAELEAALTTAQRRFELLAVVSDAMVNGVKPSVGAAECAAAIGRQK